jgi:hypothetical protein
MVVESHLVEKHMVVLKFDIVNDKMTGGIIGRGPGSCPYLEIFLEQFRGLLRRFRGLLNLEQARMDW